MHQDQENKNYLIKILTLATFTLICLLAIRYSLVRQESVDWLSDQIVHQPNPYAISQIDSGQTVVDNILVGFETRIPRGFTVENTKTPSFIYQENDQIICRVSLSALNNHKIIDLEELKKQNSGFNQTTVGTQPALFKTTMISDGSVSYESLIPKNQYTIKLALSAKQVNTDKCQNYYEQIKNSLVLN